MSEEAKLAFVLLLTAVNSVCNGILIGLLWDMRDRVKRLENRAMPPEYRGPGAHPHFKETT